jgi:hypothetical protein
MFTTCCNIFLGWKSLSDLGKIAQTHTIFLSPNTIKLHFRVVEDSKDC